MKKPLSTIKLSTTDLLVLLKNYFNSNVQSDLNKDSLVNMIDASLLISNIGK